MNTKKIFEYLRPPFEAFLISRVLILLLLVLASQLELQTVPAREGVNYESFISLELSNVSESLSKIFLSADASWYVEIAREGYHPGPLTTEKAKNWTFFPLFPMLIKWLQPVFGSFLFAGLIISNISFYLALCTINLFMKTEEVDAQTRTRAIWFCCFFPSSYFFISPLTESVFLLLSALAFMFLKLNRPILAAIAMSLTTATRPTGLMLLPAFFLALLKVNISKSMKAIALAIAPVGAASYLAYLYFLTGSPLAFSQNQAAWGRFKGSFWDLLESLILSPGRVMIGWNFVLFNAFCALLALAIAWMLYRKGKLAMATFLAIPVCCALATGSVQSMFRFVGALFPIFIGLALVTSTPNRERIAFIISALFLAVLSIMYGAHVTAGMA